MSRILIIDDDQDLRSALKSALAERGYGVLEAVDGASGLALLSAEAADLVLLDAGLPGQAGADTLKKIKQLKSAVPVVMLTGYGRSGSAPEFMDAGAAGCLQKPFDNARLLETAWKFTAGAPAAAESGTEPEEKGKSPLLRALSRTEISLICLALAALLFFVFNR